MSRKESVSDSVRNAWAKLNTKWQDEGAEIYYGDYVIRMVAVADKFNKACSKLEDVSAELQRELKIVEQKLNNS